MNEYIEFFSKHWILSGVFVGLLACLLLLELFFKTKDKAITSQQAVDLINHKTALTLDIRAREAFVKGHIVDSINIPKEELDKGLNKLRKYANKPILIVCSTGRESNSVVAKLEQEGFGQVFQLAGGVESWIAAELPLTK